MLNAMVHIPNNLTGVTIKPTKTKINPVSLAKATIGKSLTVTRVPSSGSNKLPSSGSNKLSNPFARKNLQNGNSIGRKQTVQIAQSVINPALKILPVKKIQRAPAGTGTKTPVRTARLIPVGSNKLQPLPSTLIPGSLPPGITVKRTSQLQSVPKRNIKPNPVNIQKKKANHTARKRASGEMVCVDLDDDDAASNSMGPQWYLRPEELDKKNEKLAESPKKSIDSEKTSEKEPYINEKEITEKEKESTDLEKENNKEPEMPKYIEITIEDSPAKPQPKSKRTCEVADQAITIDDSPVKAASEKPAPTSGSDEEATTSKEKHSKKKLEYPKTAKEPKTVEIEIELTPMESANVQNNYITNSQNDVAEMEVVEVEESPIKPAETFHTSTPKKKPLLKPQTVKMNSLISVNVLKSKSKLNKSRHDNQPNPQLKSNQNKTVPPTPGEFHPVYQSFIDLCFRLEDSEDMSKIVEKKIKAYYREVPKDYTESEMFTDMVSSKINAMKAGPEKMYLYIKDVVDELNLQRKIAKSQPPKVVTVNEGRSWEIQRYSVN